MRANRDPWRRLTSTREREKRERAIKRADALFSQVVRQRDGFCAVCGDSAGLQCAHIYSRRYYPTRWDLQNAMALCTVHAHYYTGHPYEWEAFCRERLGDDVYEELGRRARAVVKVDVEAVLVELKRSVA